LLSGGHKRHAGNIVLKKLPHRGGLFFIDDRPAVFNLVSIRNVSHGSTSLSFRDNPHFNSKTTSFLDSTVICSTKERNVSSSNSVIMVPLDVNRSSRCSSSILTISPLTERISPSFSCRRASASAASSLLSLLKRAGSR